MAAATLMMTLSILLLIVANLLARRSRQRASVIPEAAEAVDKDGEGQPELPLQ